MTEEKYNPMKLIDETFKRRLEKIKELTINKFLIYNIMFQRIIL